MSRTRSLNESSSVESVNKSGAAIVASSANDALQNRTSDSVHNKASDSMQEKLARIRYHGKLDPDEIAETFGKKAPSKYYDPCKEAGKASLRCMERNNQDCTKCQYFFRAFKECKQDWMEYRRNLKSTETRARLEEKQQRIRKLYDKENNQE